MSGSATKYAIATPAGCRLRVGQLCRQRREERQALLAVGYPHVGLHLAHGLLVAFDPFGPKGRRDVRQADLHGQLIGVELRVQDLLARRWQAGVGAIDGGPSSAAVEVRDEGDTAGVVLETGIV